MALPWDGALAEPIYGCRVAESPDGADGVLHALDLPNTQGYGLAPPSSTILGTGYNDASATYRSSTVAVSSPVSDKEHNAHQFLPPKRPYDCDEQFLYDPNSHQTQTNRRPHLSVAPDAEGYQHSLELDFGQLVQPYTPTFGHDEVTYNHELISGGYVQDPNYADVQQTTQVSLANSCALSPGLAPSQFGSGDSPPLPYIEVILRSSGERRSRERNRLAASRCREKSKQYMTELRWKEREQAQRKEMLASHVCALKEEVLALKTEILKHAYCDCDHIQNYLASAARQLT